MCIKPIADGSSTGVARLGDAHDLVTYARAVEAKSGGIAAGELSDDHHRVEMPSQMWAKAVAECSLLASLRARRQWSG